MLSILKYLIQLNQIATTNDLIDDIKDVHNHKLISSLIQLNIDITSLTYSLINQVMQEYTNKYQDGHDKNDVTNEYMLVLSILYNQVHNWAENINELKK